MYTDNQAEALVSFRCDLKNGDQVDNKYRVACELGKGSFGQVFKVYDTHGLPYALKILRLWEVPSSIRDTLLARFLAEYKTARIESPYIVKSLDFGYINNNPYFVMEFCGGGDVNSLMGGNYERMLEVIRQIMSGLEALHNKGKVHRDIKPENILLRDDGTVAITDFGISGDRYHRMTERNWLGRPSQMFGTYAYMSPEQIYRKRGDSTVLPTTDIFSLGVLIYQLLTRMLPFGTIESHSELVTYQKNIKEGNWNRMPLGQLPDRRKWMQVFDKCLDPDYQRRFQTIDELRRAIPFPKARKPKVEAPAHAPMSALSSAPALEAVPEPASAAPCERHFYLFVVKGEEVGRRYDLTDLATMTGRNSFTVGRGSTNDLPIMDTLASLVSRHHFTLLTADSQKWIVKDGQFDIEHGNWQSSLNGTFINERICKREGSYIREGDVIRVGDVQLKFYSE